MTDAKTPDPKAKPVDPVTDPETETTAEGEEGTEEETFEQRQARVGGFPPPHVPGEAPVSPYQSSVEEAAQTENTPAGQAVQENPADPADGKTKASKESKDTQ